MAEQRDKFPTTVEATVRLLLGLVPEDEQAKIVLMTEDDLMMLHFGLGQWIRNHLGLWGTTLPCFRPPANQMSMTHQARSFRRFG